MSKQRPRKKRRKKLSRFILSTMMMVFMSLALIVGATIFFKVEQITVDGNSHYTAEEIIAATNIQIGSNLFSIKRNEIAQKITYSLPYIQTISVKLTLPTEIRLEVQEQIGMVELVTEEGTWYMGVQGKLLERVSNTAVTPEVSLESAEENPDDLDLLVEPSPQDDITEEMPIAEPLETNLSQETQTTTLEQLSSSAMEDMGQIADSLLSWTAPTIDYTLELDPDDPVIRVTGLTPIDPRPGELIQVAEEDEKQLTSLLSLFESLEENQLLTQVSQINLHIFQYFEFNYAGRFLVKFPFTGDYDYKLRALTKAVSDIEHYETGTMDLTQEQYAVLFMPD